MIGKIKEYIIDENFKIIISGKYIDIINYKSIIEVKSSYIFFSYGDNFMEIKGSNIKVIAFNKNEILIKGDFNEIKYK